MSPRNLTGKSLVLLASFLFSNVTYSAMPNYALAAQLASKAQSNVRQREATNMPVTQNLRNQRNRKSAIDSSILTAREAGCGGLALGNVRPMLGDHRQHNVMIVVTGNIINSGNNC
jgi:glutamine phosphoribosylpyrophosphate amidotransferase